MENYLLYIDKPKDFTSFDVCNYLKKALKLNKVGHTGTLDPNATGVMVILCDKASKLNQFIVSHSKEYLVEVKYGVLTDSLDMDGNIILEEHYTSVDNLKIIEALKKYETTYQQEIPMTSAKKINGMKLVDYQRKGIKIAKQYKEVTVYKNIFISSSSEGFCFKTSVSSGCFVRSLVQDILKELNTIGVVKELRRTKLGSVDIENCVKLKDISIDSIQKITPYDYLCNIYPIIEVNNVEAVKNGKPLKLNTDEKKVLICFNKQVLAIYQKEGDLFRSVRGLF